MTQFLFFILSALSSQVFADCSLEGQFKHLTINGVYHQCAQVVASDVIDLENSWVRSNLSSNGVLQITGEELLSGEYHHPDSFAAVQCFKHLNSYIDIVSDLSGHNIRDYHFRPLQCIIDTVERCNASHFSGMIFIGAGESYCQGLYDNKSLIYHEATHWLNQLFAGSVIDNILDEALADSFQAIILNSSIFAPDFNSNRLITHLRDIDTFMRYPHDFHGDAHVSSMIFSSTLWRFFELLQKNYSLIESQSMMMQALMFYIQYNNLHNGFETFGESFLRSFETLFSHSPVVLGLTQYLIEAGLLDQPHIFDTTEYFAPHTQLAGKWFIEGIPLLLSNPKYSLCSLKDENNRPYFQLPSGEIVYQSKRYQIDEEQIIRFSKSVEEIKVQSLLRDNSSVRVEITAPAAAMDYQPSLLYITINSSFLFPDDLEFAFDIGQKVIPLQKGRGEMPLSGMFLPALSGELIINQYGRGIPSAIDSINVYSIPVGHCRKKER